MARKSLWLAAVVMVLTMVSGVTATGPLPVHAASTAVPQPTATDVVGADAVTDRQPPGDVAIAKDIRIPIPVPYCFLVKVVDTVATLATGSSWTANPRDDLRSGTTLPANTIVYTFQRVCRIQIKWVEVGVSSVLDAITTPPGPSTPPPLPVCPPDPTPGPNGEPGAAPVPPAGC